MYLWKVFRQQYSKVTNIFLSRTQNNPFLSIFWLRILYYIKTFVDLPFHISVCLSPNCFYSNNWLDFHFVFMLDCFQKNLDLPVFIYFSVQGSQFNQFRVVNRQRFIVSTSGRGQTMWWRSRLAKQPQIMKMPVMNNCSLMTAFQHIPLLVSTVWWKVAIAPIVNCYYEVSLTTK